MPPPPSAISNSYCSKTWPSAGYQPGRPPQIKAGLRWLARLIPIFRVPGRWASGNKAATGTWTPAEEFQRMPRRPPERCRPSIDRVLKNARFQTLLHEQGPGRLSSGKTPKKRPPSVRFQYVGVGCGIRDVAYFLDCCLSYTNSEEKAPEWLDFSYSQTADDLPEGLESEWRRLSGGLE